ncbi:MAG: 2OG-Fe(II) oxygenase [Pseudomonadota bacterium]
MSEHPTLEALQAAAERGSVDDAFRFGLALVDAQRMTDAHAWYLRAAEAGHPLAQIEVARLRLYGLVGAPAPQAAVEWLLRAERSGHPAASELLMQIALGGAILPRDARINERLHRAIQADFPPALLTAAIHFGRKPHPEDQALSLQLFERAAAGGSAIAAALLAERLAHGEGCEAQPDTAADLWAQLSANGVPRLPDFTLPPPGPEGPPRQLGIEDALHPPPARILSATPKVSVIDRLFSADECRLYIASAQPHLHRSQTADPITGVPDTRALRTSSETCFDPLLETGALRVAQLRMAAAAGIDLPNAEQLTVLRYEPGQQYFPHRDYLPPGTLQMDRPHAGNRARTAIVFLNAVEAGGATEFPVPGLRVDPLPGRAVIFDNLLPDGRPDPDSLHAGTPVETGEKWLATLWIRQGRYRTH